MRDRTNRWTNWDAMAIGEDFWDDLDEMDERRQRELRVTRQMETLRRVHKRRFSKLKIDMSKFESDEPYASMCARPDGTKAPPMPKPPKKGQKQKYHDHKRAAEDRQIVADNHHEIRGMIRRRRTLKSIAAEFGISYRIMMQEAKKWQTK